MIRFDAKSHENTFYLLSKDKETEKTLRSQKAIIDTIFLYLIYIYRNPTKLVDLRGISLYIVYFFIIFLT